MRYREIVERYTSHTADLLHYFRDNPRDHYAIWQDILRIIDESDNRDAIFARLYAAAGLQPEGNEYSLDELQDADPSIFYKLPEKLQQDIYNAAIDDLLTYAPELAPTTAHMALRSKKPLHRLTWLVHFTDNPNKIAANGFIYGMDRMDSLALTTLFTDETKKHGGYNFAFIANSRYAKNAADGKYGDHAVLFQNSGIHAYHYGDEEEQIIFYGKDVDPRDIVVLRSYGSEWDVMSRRPTRRGGGELFGGEFETCVRWVVKNFQQYRHYLTRR